MRTIKISFLIFLLAMLSFRGNCETHQLDLAESIAIAKMKSFDMLSLKQDLKITEYNLKSATSQFKTHVDLDLDVPNYTETYQQDEDSSGITYYRKQQSELSSVLTINQPLPTDGNVYISSGLLSNDDYIKDKRLLHMNTRLGVTQPIDALYGYNKIKSEFKRAELAYEQSQKRLKREELNLVYYVSNSFYRLLQVQKREEIALMNLERQKDAFQIAKNKFDAGLIREVDALQMEVDLAEAQNNYDLAVIDRSSAENEFKELIGVGLSDTVVISSDIDYQLVDVDEDMAVELALQNRTEIREQEISIELNQLNLKRQKAEGMITGNLNAYYEKTGVNNLSRSDNMGDLFNGSFKNFQDSNGDFGVRLSINIPIIDWGENKALVQAAEARLKQNQYRMQETTRAIETEVKNLVAGLNSSLKRLQLLEKNVEVAEKSFEITRMRYSDGDIDSQDLALERERLNNAYISHLSSYIQYELNLADLMRKTFYDFKKDAPVL